MREQIDEVLGFWFGNLVDGFPSDRHFSMWWHPNDESDELVSRHFNHYIHLALRGQLNTWSESPRGRLALIILLDQFTRRVFRGQNACFSGDERALFLCHEGIALGHDQALTLGEQWMYYKPLEHSELLSDQTHSLRYYETLCANAPPSYKAKAQLAVDIAWEHYEQIKKFGRFPRRNQILERKCTAEELLYLQLGRKC